MYNNENCTTCIPERLRRLPDLAANLRFSWDDRTRRLFSDLDERLWTIVNHNPIKFLREIDPGRLSEAAADRTFTDRYDQAVRRFTADMEEEDTWFAKNYPRHTGHLIAYFSMEFGLHESLPVYSGGLGILAGDHLKTASNLRVPVAGVGLLYRVSYFTQFITFDGRQQAVYVGAEFSGLPLQLVKDDRGEPVTVTVPAAGRDIHVRIWKADVGRVPLLLLDTDFFRNRDSDRLITERLYDSDRDYRLLQELVLGVGGVRALQALQLPVSIYHLNEGHSALLNLERIDQFLRAGSTWQEALNEVKASTVFTTHTPVPAGNEVFEKERMERVLGHHLQILNMEEGRGWNLGQCGSEEADDTFNLTIFALRTSRRANAVSRLHGEVSRGMWQRVWPELPADQVPVISVTNGVHARTWIHGSLQKLYREHLGEDWFLRLDDDHFRAGSSAVPDDALWQVHTELKSAMIKEVRRRVAGQRDRNGEGRAAVCAAGRLLKNDALTIGFARRFAPYKRAALLLHDMERLKRLASAAGRPVQFVFAGKAHPADREGMQLIQDIYTASRSAGLEQHLVLVENYDMALSKLLVAGCDCWLNTPRRPHEASGTSGMKAALNGCLNISIKDGWWAEACDDAYGWSIGTETEESDQQQQDEADSAALYSILENSVVPAYYDREGSAYSSHWLRMMKSSAANLTPRFCTDRMLKEYLAKLYFRDM